MFLNCNNLVNSNVSAIETDILFFLAVLGQNLCFQRVLGHDTGCKYGLQQKNSLKLHFDGHISRNISERMPSGDSVH